MSSNGQHSNGYSLNNRISLLKGGIAYFNLLQELLDGADESIYIQIYIFNSDATGTRIADALIRASKRGVKVFVLADGYASQWLPSAFIKKMKQSGVHFRFFEPLLRSSKFYFGRRLHQKVIVIDGEKAIVGGINIADRYNDIKGQSAWLDYALLVEGDTAFQLKQHCMEAWKGQKEAAVLAPPAEVFPAGEQTSVRIRINDWVKGKQEVWRTYFDLFNRAEERITILCSYFLPGRVLRHRLALAARRGVKVQLILAGPSDVMLAKNAERYLYRWMMKNGIEIYEYQPVVLHGKVMVTDAHWVTIGSFNVNNISAYASIEMNLDVRNRRFATSVQEMLDEIMVRDCIRVTEKNFATNATVFKRVVQKSAYEVIRGILNLSTFYFKHE